MNIRNILKKYLRDIPTSLFLIIGMGLSFFLLINSVNLIDAVTKESENAEKEKYAFSKKYEILRPNDKSIQDGNQMWASETDFDGRAFFEDVVNICSEYSGNSYLNTAVRTQDNSSHLLKAYLSLNEDLIINKINNERDINTTMESAPKGIYVPEGMQEYIESTGNKDYIIVNNQKMKVAGIVKDYSVDMSKDVWTVMWTQLNAGFIDVVYSCEKPYIYVGNTGLIVTFESNKSNPQDALKIIEEKLISNGYIIKDITDWYAKGEGVSEYVLILNIVNVVLLLFAIISCMYVVNLWIDRRTVEMMIRKSFGHNIKQIIKVIICDLFKLGLISAALAVAAQVIYKKFTSDMVMASTINLESVILTLAGMCVVVMLMLVVPIIKVIKISPATGIKDI